MQQQQYIHGVCFMRCSNEASLIDDSAAIFLRKHPGSPYSELRQDLNEGGGLLRAGEVVAPVDDKVRYACHSGCVVPQLLPHLPQRSTL